MIHFTILIFLASFILVSWAGSWVVGALMRVARYLGWREFVVAFFLMAFAASLPNFAIGVISALQGIPELSFGDVVGGNVVDLTLSVALVILVSGVSLPAHGVTLQTSAILTSLIAVVPLVLILDGGLTRSDGGVLIGVFFLYIFWLFSKGERFKRPYDGKEEEQPPTKRLKDFFKDLGRAFMGVFLLVVGAQGVVSSASLLAQILQVPLPVLGILMVGLGNSLPEIYFAILSARQRKTEMILGDLMGSVIVPATLVLGTVVLIHPIAIEDFSPFAIARFFLIVAAVLFYIAARTERKINRGEAIVLLCIYFLFLFLEIITKKW